MTAADQPLCPRCSKERMVQAIFEGQAARVCLACKHSEFADKKPYFDPHEKSVNLYRKYFHDPATPMTYWKMLPDRWLDFMGAYDMVGVFLFRAAGLLCLLSAVVWLFLRMGGHLDGPS